MMTERKREFVIFFMVLACVVLVALDGSQFFARVDLTEDHVFTISPETRALLKSIPQEIHVNYYISNDLRQLSPVPGQIIDMLHEYAADSHGRIRLSIVDPQIGVAAEAVRRFGILPQQMKVIKQNEQRVEAVYSGLEFEYLDRSIVIPFVFNPQTLEYSLTLTIRRIMRNSPAIVGIIVGDQSQTLQGDYSMLAAQLSLSFGVRDIKAGAEIPSETSVLVVLGGTDLSAKQILPIDQFIMNGGHVLFAVKALKVDTKQRLTATPVETSPLLEMLAEYGIDVGRAIVLDSSSRDYRLPQNNFGKVQWMDLGKYPEWISVLPQNVSLDNPVTRRFSGLDLLWPSPLRLEPRSGVTAEVLVKSTKQAWLMMPPFETDPFKVGNMTGVSNSSLGQYALAYALSGHFESYFSKVKAASLSAGKDSNLRILSPDVRMIIVGDVDFASDLMQFSDSSYNALFMENAVEWLSADSDLLSIKTRNYQDTRLSRIQDVSLRSRLIVVAETANIALIPLIVLGFGVFRRLSRRERVMSARAKRRVQNGGE